MNTETYSVEVVIGEWVDQNLLTERERERKLACIRQSGFAFMSCIVEFEKPLTAVNSNNKNSPRQHTRSLIKAFNKACRRKYQYGRDPGKWH